MLNNFRATDQVKAFALPFNQVLHCCLLVLNLVKRLVNLLHHAEMLVRQFNALGRWVDT